DSYGRGAGARFKVRQRLNRFPWRDAAFVDVERPRRILVAGRAGKLGRIKVVSEWTLEPAHGGTRVSFTTESVPVTPAEKLLDVIWGTRRTTKRRAKRALQRLAAILEEGAERGTRATIAGGARKPATGAPIR
ncbi:MAG TPA: SRPBCC family protein, partial [Solirubrobacteraceae bacterium]